MANPSQRHQNSTEKNRLRIETELKNMNQGQAQSSGSGKTIMTDTVCKPIHCQEARQRHHPPDLAGSPWHIKKTIFLVGLIVLLVIWAISYGILSYFKII
ncbi:hypothetical protein HHI36_001834 [Cryptolaemus montrouzieri]|uniref:Uncharacterized protein n=1 Tax=Cryptolaemus montrouzieri TaxID=559131 RepID=A0ABD2PA45_9CUCU